jgi:hypothetical protein
MLPGHGTAEAAYTARWHFFEDTLFTSVREDQILGNSKGREKEPVLMTR